MRLAPRQLTRAGMTGNVAYYGGRLTPTQAYAASHPQWQPPPGTSPFMTGGTAPAAPADRTPAPEKAAPTKPTRTREETVAALRDLLDTGVITQEEFEHLNARIGE